MTGPIKANFPAAILSTVQAAMGEGFDKNPSKMSDEEYSSWVAERMMGGWVPLRDYLRIYPGETQAKIDTRLARGVWRRGEHYAVPPQSRAWVNLPAIRRWIESGGFDAEAEA